MFISTNTASQPRSNPVPKFFVLIAMIGACLGGAMASWADIGIGLKKVPPLSARTFLPQPAFEKATKVESEAAPYNDKYIPYEIRIPKIWSDNVQGGIGELKTDNKVLSDSILSILGKYIGKPKNLVTSNITVEAQILPYEINVRDWFVNFILKNGFALTGLTVKSERELEAMYVQVIDDQTYAVRTRVIINGPRLVMVRYYLPQDNFEDEKNMQAQVIASFKLLAPSTERIEKQLEYGFLDQSYFNYPASWAIRTKSIYSVERMSAQLYQEIVGSDPTILDGQIKINVISRLLKTSLADEVKDFRDKTNIPGYSIGPLIENIDYKYDDSIQTGKSQAYQLIPKDKAAMKNYEFIVTVMQGADFYYITSLITPSRDQDFMIWARNMETLRIVNESVRRSNVHIDPNDPYFDYLKEQPQ